MTATARRRAGFLCSAAAFAIVGAYVLGAMLSPLAEPDETRYAEIAREMLVRGDWITPHLNFVKYFEKPPLVYWESALAFRALGVNEPAARLPSLLAALAGIVLVWVLARRMYGRAEARLAALILATAPLYSILGETLTLDMSLTLFITCGLTAVWIGFERRQVWWYRLAWLAVAGGVLVKGPVAGVLVCGPAAVFLLLQGGWGALRVAADVPGMALAALLALPWFVLVSWRNPEFIQYFVVDQHIKRYLWTHEHGEPFWFFLPQLPALMFPWGLLPVLDPGLWWDRRAPSRWSAPTRFLAIWAAFIVAFFSLSSSKLITYVLPALPPLAILLARVLVRGLQRERRAFLVRVGWLVLVLGIGTAVAGVILPFVSTHRRVPLVIPYLYAGGLILLATGAAMRAALRGPRLGNALAVLGGGAIALLALCCVGHSLVESYPDLGRTAAALMRPADRLVVYRHQLHGMAFYARRRFVMVRGRGELRFGSEHGNHEAYFWPDDDALVREWSGGGGLFLVINRKELVSLRSRLDPAPVQVAAQGKKVLVVNRDLAGNAPAISNGVRR